MSDTPDVELVDNEPFDKSDRESVFEYVSRKLNEQIDWEAVKVYGGDLGWWYPYGPGNLTHKYPDAIDVTKSPDTTKDKT